LMSISSYMPVVANRGGDLGGGLGGIGRQTLGVGGEGPAEEVEEEGEGPRDGRRGAAPEVGGRGRRLEHPVQRLRLCVQRGGGEGTVRGGCIGVAGNGLVTRRRPVARHQKNIQTHVSN